MRFRTTPIRAVRCALLLLTAAHRPLVAQTTYDLATERAEYAAWLSTAAVSPLAAIAQQPIGEGLRLGPSDAEVPLERVSAHRVRQRAGSIVLESAAGTRTMPRRVPVRLGDYTITADGPPGRAVLTVFGARHPGHAPTYYEREPSLVFVGPLLPPRRKETTRVLGLDGIEVEAVEAGSVLVPLGRERVRLRVLRLPTAGSEESELQLFFRDGTNGRGTYPAGRFVELLPVGNGRYRLDFNRARNPFCAYSSAYPCPAPWRGNSFDDPVRAGERYESSGPEAPKAATEVP
jgi:uncharacterized protein (DUF1684 family)